MATTRSASPAGRRRRCRTSACRRPSRCCRRRSTPTGWSDSGQRWRRGGYDHLVVWGDREHSANIAYLTGFDPRFEEAVLIVGRRRPGDPRSATSATAWPRRRRCRCDRVRFQDLSLPGQPRDAIDAACPRSSATRASRAGGRVGVVGWKTYANRETIEAPAFLVDELRTMTGPSGLVENATDLLHRPSRRAPRRQRGRAAGGVRVGRVPDVARRAQRAHRPPARDDRAGGGQLLEWNGSPLSCHLMLTAGPRARFGLLSPGDRPIERGDPFTIAFGIWGALNCRAGFVVEDPSELPDGIDDYVERLVAPVLRGGGRVVRGAARRPGREASCRRSSTATSATRSSASRSTRATSSTSTSG